MRVNAIMYLCRVFELKAIDQKRFFEALHLYCGGFIHPRVLGSPLLGAVCSSRWPSYWFSTSTRRSRRRVLTIQKADKGLKIGSNLNLKFTSIYQRFGFALAILSQFQTIGPLKGVKVLPSRSLHECGGFPSSHGAPAILFCSCTWLVFFRPCVSKRLTYNTRCWRKKGQ